MTVTLPTLWQLPIDVLSCVLDQLDQPAVLRAAAVSTHWRNCATHHPNYYRHVAFQNGRDGRHVGTIDVDRVSKKFHDTVDNALSTTTRLGVFICVYDPTSGQRDDLIAAIITLASALRRIMPLVCKLRIVLPARSLVHRFLAVLQAAPAPILRSLSVRLTDEIPKGLFQLIAPKLTVVTLEDRTRLPSTEIAALSQVTSLVLERVAPDVLVASLRNLPNLRHLSCKLLEEYRGDDVLADLTLDTSVVRRLQSLHISANCRTDPGQRNLKALEQLCAGCPTLRTVTARLTGDRHFAQPPPKLSTLQGPLVVSLVYVPLSDPIRPPSYSPLDNAHLNIESDQTGATYDLLVVGLTVDWCFKSHIHVYSNITRLRMLHWYLRGATPDASGEFPPGSYTHVFAFLPKVEELRIDIANMPKWLPNENWERELRLFSFNRAEAVELVKQQPRAWPALRELALTASDGSRPDVNKSARRGRTPRVWTPPKAVVVARDHLANYARLLRLPSMSGERPALVLSEFVVLESAEGGDSVARFLDNIDY
ncbi:hypothetical protein EXIGLDRAFT_737506 [Exidia glandulosa HHB12029]|uniref:F-box domain-containing protein n=1 Tax=Exidia glandulosa HHB12029 TaxID=1314781 RepID=A0A166AQ22_EXIGL|nr:hypothetical protein EXIGLDRAFT_737506 [Exidia glandulosa HHB12029]